VIAVVDDDALIRKALVRLLRASGFASCGFASGQEFLESWLREPPDCLILDLQMPGMSGIEVLQTLSRAEAHLPTIIITAHDEPAARAECLRHGVVAYLRKPLDDRVLLDALQAIATPSVSP
jgi:FixJ family two-component response regulator